MLQVVAINDVCPHRGAPLHMGWTSEVDGHNCVVCPYHGAVLCNLLVLLSGCCGLPPCVGL